MSVLAMSLPPRLYEVFLSDAILVNYQKENGMGHIPLAEFLSDFVLALSKPVFAANPSSITTGTIKFQHCDEFSQEYGPTISITMTPPGSTPQYAALLQRLNQAHSSLTQIQPSSTSSTSTSSSSTSHPATSTEHLPQSSNHNEGGTKRSAEENSNKPQQKYQKIIPKKKVKGCPRLRIAARHVAEN